jgi:hypothetical protein
LQLLQSSPPEAAARSQWPRARHSGLIHCTVHPGKYCTFLPLYIPAGSKSSPHPIPAGSTLHLKPFAFTPAGVKGSGETFSVKVEPAPAGRTRDLFRCGPWTRNETEKLRGFCVYALVVSRGKIQSLVVVLHMAQLYLDPSDFR